jgi:hypothetical protein
MSGRADAFMAAVEARIDERAQPDLGQHARALGCHVAQHVEQHAARQVPRRNLLVADHGADARRLERRRSARIRATDHPGEHAGLGEVIDALDAVHVAGADGHDDGQAARPALGAEARAQRREEGVRRVQSGRAAHREHGAIRHQRGRALQGNDFRTHSNHFMMCRPTSTFSPR